MKIKEEYDNPSRVLDRLDLLAFVTVQAALATLLFALYYFISFEVAVIAALSILIMSSAQP